MLKLMLAAVMAALLMPAAASAGTPQDPCEHNPTTLCDGDTVTVEPATAEECPNGGVVVVITNGDDVDRFPVCNGSDGTPGAPGTDGSNGADGTDGTNGTNGTNGSNGAPGTDGTDGSSPSACVSRRVVHLTLKKRFGHPKRVRVQVAGQWKRLKVHSGRHHRSFIRVSLKGKPAGIYAVNVRKRGVRPMHLLYGTCGFNISGFNRPLR